MGLRVTGGMSAIPLASRRHLQDCFPMALEIEGSDLTNRVKASFTPVGSEAVAPALDSLTPLAYTRTGRVSPCERCSRVSSMPHRHTRCVGPVCTGGHMTTKSPHALCVPIYNLRISNDLGGELRVGDVTFIAARKIPRIRRRLGIPEVSGSDFFSQAETYAHLKTRRGERDPLTAEFLRIRQAVFLLASSQFYRERRTRRTFFGGPEYNTSLEDQYLLVDITSRSAVLNWQRLSPVEPYTLDKQWQGFFRHHFFPKMLRIINGQVTIPKRWSYYIRDAALCAGQSHWARTRWEALLYDMIGIETLLTHRGDTFPDALVERVDALFGWITDNNPTPWKDLISRLYSLRCNFVHDADVRGVTMQDIMNADMILANLLYNICALPKIFHSKQAIISLAERVKARRVLGMRPARPKRLHFVQQSITEPERIRLEHDRHWAW